MPKVKDHLRLIDRPIDMLDRTPYLRLDKNELVTNTVDRCSDTIAGILGDITPEFLAMYPNVYPLYERLSHKHDVDVNNVFIAAGSDACIRAIFDAYIDPGDEILMIHPTYGMYYTYSDIYRAKRVEVSYRSDLSMTLEDVLSSVTLNTKLMILPNPNSPTGTALTPDEMEGIIDIADLLDILIVIDEAYYPFYPDTAMHMTKRYSNLVIMRTFSKAYGLASLRIGYAVSSKEVIENLYKVRPFNDVTGIGAYFALKMLDVYGDRIVEMNCEFVNEGKAYVEKEMKKIGFFAIPSRTNFLNIVVGKDMISTCVKACEQEGILIRTGDDRHPLLAECICVAVGSKEDMKPLIKVIRDVNVL